jgi:hypothetical protein
MAAVDPAHRMAVNDLMYRYAYALDDRAWGELATLFAPDASCDFTAFGGVLTGGKQIAEWCKEQLGRLDATQHIIGNVSAAIAGDRASVVSYFQAQHVRRGLSGGENFTVGGTYRDEIVHIDAEWLIARHALDVTWSSGNPDVLAAS